MNLQQITVGIISAINPQINCLLRMSIGNTQLPSGVRVPAYASFPNIACQIQPLNADDLAMLERPGVSTGLNMQGSHQAVYINGDWEGLDRAAIKGGDLLTMPDGSVWLITQTLENWPDWTKFACTLQNDGT